MKWGDKTEITEILLFLPVSNIHLLKTFEDVSGCVVYASFFPILLKRI